MPFFSLIHRERENALGKWGKKVEQLTLCSLFDGSGGFCLRGIMAGIKPVSCSEIEPFPIRVTTKRLPFVKHYGDVSKINGAEIEPVDIITFGSPCQNLSIAGKREGLCGNRSSLFFQAIRIIKEMRCATNGKYPRFAVWENVPGCQSSNGGEDFRCVLEEFCKIKDTAISVPKPAKWTKAGEIVGDDYSIAYRTFDAQYWGIAQRRKRIYLVADFAGGSAGKILFESEGVSGYSAEGFASWKRTAGNSEAGLGAAGGICLNDQGGERMDVTEEVTCTLRAESHHPPCVLTESATIYENHSQDARYTGPLDAAPTVSAHYGTGGNNQPFVVQVETPKTLKIRSGCEGGGKGALIQDNKSATLSCNNDQTVFVPQAYGISSKDSNAMKSDNPHSGFYEADTSRTLDTAGGNPGCNQGGIAVVESYALQGSMIGRNDKNGPQGDGVNKDVSFTRNTADRHAVAYPTYCASKSDHFTRAEEELANTLVATDYKEPPLINNTTGNEDMGYIVRRLTPTECARLQGFPDWWCADLGTENPTDEDSAFWRKVFETHRKLTGTSSKPKTDKQIVKWLKDPHTDAAEYKM